ncbi:hypothetical protein ETH_00014570 [Eimeria tenella]|uniref:Uncharacterized protein n=1 Tax=Eimeria tenella TaxID=5802 RepID=U6LA06_EIMTE|nr:hypothetical protein ETH_00014570 [Eimeria tenella]CDJ44605.1 hypothetical protein ETH_00014570 [Eimeria tenella]|eukprot:XP_013235353.1 hypothetical protein ETH_00014570 [Eimeria tenella]
MSKMSRKQQQQQQQPQPQRGPQQQQQLETIGRSRAQQKKFVQFKASLFSPYIAPWPRALESAEEEVVALLEG